MADASTPNWFTDAYVIARQYGLDPSIVRALIRVESGGNQWAWNPEPRYRYYWDTIHNKPFRAVTEDEIRSERPPADFRALSGDPDQEWWAQSASWGLMQVMGAVARELGCTDPYLPILCDHYTNLSWGCMKLARLVKWANGDIEQALAAYNGGQGGNSTRPFRNAAYANKVIKEIARIPT